MKEQDWILASYDSLHAGIDQISAYISKVKRLKLNRLGGGQRVVELKKEKRPADALKARSDVKSSSWVKHHASFQSPITDIFIIITTFDQLCICQIKTCSRVVLL